MKSIFTVLVGIAMVQAIAKIRPEDELFSSFKHKYNKKYGCSDEEGVRFTIFKNTWKKVNEHNKLYREGKSSFTMGINRFADMMPNEVPTGGSVQHPPVEEFAKFKVDYHRHYQCPQSEQLRFKIFELNLKDIIEHNKKYANGESTYFTGINQFTDRLPNEIQ